MTYSHWNFKPKRATIPDYAVMRAVSMAEQRARNARRPWKMLLVLAVVMGVVLIVADLARL